MQCPVCNTPHIHLHSQSKVLDPGEEVGVVFCEEKAGCSDWQALVVGYSCHKGHIFWVNPRDVENEAKKGRRYTPTDP